MLLQARTALDRAEALREEIERDGPAIHTRNGIKDHPALRHEIANRALSRLGLKFEPTRTTIGRPPG